VAREKGGRQVVKSAARNLWIGIITLKANRARPEAGSMENACSEGRSSDPWNRRYSTSRVPFNYPEHSLNPHLTASEGRPCQATLMNSFIRFKYFNESYDTAL